MSLNICIDCKSEKKQCNCSTEEIKISWWRRIFTWWWE